MSARAQGLTLRERAASQSARRDRALDEPTEREHRAILKELPRPMETYNVTLKARSATGRDFTLTDQLPADSDRAALEALKQANAEALEGATVYHTSIFLVRQDNRGQNVR